MFAELAGCHAAWTEALRRWNVQQSQQVLQWQAEALQRGRMEGELKGRAESVLRLLQRHSGTAVPADLAAMIRNNKDLATLDHWLDLAAEVTSLDEFRRRVSS